MGLVDLRKTSIMATINRGGGVTSALRNSNGDGGIVRKKRTFDIAFLTGQEDLEEKVSAMAKPTSISGGSSKKSDHGVNKTANARPEVLDESSSNSECSSIDVMTNGSLSESESNLSGCVGLNVGGKALKMERPSPSPTGFIISGTAGGKPRDKNSATEMFLGRLNNNNVAKGSRKRYNELDRGEEIRFESRRTVDINQTSESLKIKENVQFSTTLGSSSISSLTPGGLGASPDLLPFALLPQIAKFPGVHLPSPFSAKMEKAEGINLLSAAYPGNGAKMNTSVRHHPPPPSPFPDPYLNIHIGPVPYPGYPVGLSIIPHEMNRSPPNTSYPSPPHHPHLSVSHGTTGASPRMSMSSPIMVNSSPTNTTSPSNSSASPNSHSQLTAASAAAAVAAAAAAATLLPPSLTALTLPAQNVCAKCNIGFRMTSDLVYHMRSHHKRDRDTDPLKKKREEKLKCPVCHESFRERHHLTRHMTAHQDREEENEEKILSIT